MSIDIDIQRVKIKEIDFYQRISENEEKAIADLEPEDVISFHNYRNTYEIFKEYFSYRIEHLNLLLKTKISEEWFNGWYQEDMQGMYIYLNKKDICNLIEIIEFNIKSTNYIFLNYAEEYEAYQTIIKLYGILKDIDFDEYGLVCYIC